MGLDRVLIQNQTFDFFAPPLSVAMKLSDLFSQSEA